MTNTYIDESKTNLGFWIYIMTDCVLFASVFATYAVLANNTFGGPSGKDLFDLPFVLVETLILLTSSFVAGIMMLAARKGFRKQVLMLLAAVFVLGASFITMELIEFSHLIQEGHTWEVSAFLSAFFTLVGMHGLHILVGLLWAGTLFIAIAKNGLNHHLVRKLGLFNLFWHFLDIVWIFIFTIVYLMGVI